MTDPIALSPPGEREVMDEEKARAMISGWRSKLMDHREQSQTQSSVLCNKISLSDKSYTQGAAALIAEFLTSTDEFNPSIASGIVVANLSDIIAGRMEDEGLQVLNLITSAFQQSKLMDVDLSDNALGNKGLSQCATVLSGDAVSGSLERLSLCNNGLSEYSMDEVADLLTRTQSQSNGNANANDDANTNNCIAQNLTKIHFYNNMSGNKGCVAFERIMLRCSDKLQDIRFSGTRARSQGSAHIASALSSLAQNGFLKNLTRLDLADNTFSECLNDIASALKHCKNLQYLDLHDCVLKDEGMQHVCDALLESKAPLQFLDFSGNEITATGTKSVAKLIKSVNSTLTKFAAEENEMTSYGIKRIANAFNSETIKEILLNCNECGAIGGNAIIQMMNDGRMPKLESIKLDENMFPEDVVESLTQVFGDKLAEMEDNDDEEDVDADLEEEKEDESESSIDELAGAMGKITMN